MNLVGSSPGPQHIEREIDTNVDIRRRRTGPLGSAQTAIRSDMRPSAVFAATA